MPANATRYLENGLLNHVFGASTLTIPGLWLAAFTTVPTATALGVEVTGGSYARIQMTGWTAAVAGSVAKTSVSFPAATANWGTIVVIGVTDASSAGNLLWYTRPPSAVTVNSGDTLTISTVTLLID